MSQKSDKKQKTLVGLLWVTAAVAVVMAVLAVMGVFDPREPLSGPGQTRPVQTTAPTDPADPTTAPTRQETVPEDPVINLGGGLAVTDAGSYTGMYMEDGSNEILSSVAMIVVRNDGDDDIQLADIEVSWGGELLKFRLTNLASGKRVVLLEQERRECPAGEPDSAVVKNTALFSEPMDLREELIGISGMEGVMNIRNISGEAITGDIYVYYKYAAEDLYYGGITFRVKVEGGMADGEIRQIPAGHYDPEGCAIVHVECHG